MNLCSLNLPKLAHSSKTYIDLSLELQIIHRVTRQEGSQAAAAARKQKEGGSSSNNLSSRMPRDSMLYEKIVPATLILFALITVTLIIFALAVLLGLVSY